MEAEDFDVKSTEVRNVITEDVDDSWIFPEDKKALLLHLKNLYSTKYPWADDNLMKCLIKYHYNLTVKEINKLDYLKEKETVNIDDYLEQI